MEHLHGKNPPLFDPLGHVRKRATGPKKSRSPGKNVSKLTPAIRINLISFYSMGELMHCCCHDVHIQCNEYVFHMHVPVCPTTALTAFQASSTLPQPFSTSLLSD